MENVRWLLLLGSGRWPGCRWKKGGKRPHICEIREAFPQPLVLDLDSDHESKWRGSQGSPDRKDARFAQTFTFIPISIDFFENVHQVALLQIQFSVIKPCESLNLHPTKLSDKTRSTARNFPAPLSTVTLGSYLLACAMKS